MFYDKKQLETNQEEIRAKASPSQLAMMDEVQTAIDAENAEMDDRLANENKLRFWARKLFGRSVSVTELEQLVPLAQAAAPRSFLVFKDISKKESEAPAFIILYKTQFGVLDRADNYITALEKTVIDITSNSQFTNLKFWDLIKLAFNRLLNRRENV